MAKDLPNKSTQTTSSIFDTLRHTDDGLSEDSEFKKKEAAKRFFEQASYLALMESIHIYENNLILMRKQKEDATQFAYEQAVKQSRAKELDLIILMETKRQLVQAEALTRAQYEKLNEIQLKLTNLLSTFDDLIDKLNQKIDTQHDVTQIALANAVVARNELTKHWRKHFENQVRDPDFKPQQINIAIPDNWKTIPEAKEYKGYIEIDKDHHQKLGEDIANELENGKASVAEIRNIVKNKVQLLLESILFDKFAYIEKEQREQFAVQTSKDKKIYQPVVESIWYDVLSNKGLLDKHETALEKERIYVKEVVKYELLKEALQEAKIAKEEVKKELSTLNEMLNVKKINEKSGEMTMDNITNKIDGFVEQKLKQVDEISSSVELKIEKIENEDKSLDDLLNECDEIPIPTVVPKDEAKQAETIQAFEEMHHKIDDVLNISSIQSQENLLKPTKDEVTVKEIEEDVSALKNK